MPEQKIDIYPVGWLAAILRARGCWAHRWLIPQGPAEARRTLAAELRRTRRLVKERQWRALKNQFNGYLAEPEPWPEGLRRCGSGWTRKRAIRSLSRHTARTTGSSPSEVDRG